MRAVLPNILAALLLIHAVLGCCWHHAHHCQQCDQAATAIEHDHDGCGHEHNDQPATPCKCKLECSGVCTYLPSQRTHFEFMQIVSPLDALTMLPTTDSQTTASSWERLCGSLESQPPLRLHLLHQVLLI